jgi:hypothetical protein
MGGHWVRGTGQRVERWEAADILAWLSYWRWVLSGLRGPPLPQSLAGTEEEGSGGNPAASVKA